MSAESDRRDEIVREVERLYIKEFRIELEDAGNEFEFVWTVTAWALYPEGRYQPVFEETTESYEDALSLAEEVKGHIQDFIAPRAAVVILDCYLARQKSGSKCDDPKCLGWCHMSDSMGNGPGIERCDSCAKFEDDDAAVAAHDRECSEGKSCKYRIDEE